MSDESNTENVQEEIQYITIEEFLEGTPPNRFAHISNLARFDERRLWDVIRTPEIQLHCPNESCNGIRFFRFSSNFVPKVTVSLEFYYISYTCSNCQKYVKTFSLAAHLNKQHGSKGRLYKFGEFPVYGPPTPPKLINLIGPDRDSFLKGRRCENQGLGIGAFIYYRRVVENQKNRILNEIIRVSEKISAPKENIAMLRQAIDETQFSKALDMAKDVIPESLLINGHSPIFLLHRALSVGVHSLTDEKCLELASSIRIVLGELSERLSQALKDEAELVKALSTLMNNKKG